ncbi:MFS transporter [Candidatus Gromoviella agglomerans]|uniref:MFS transporter n=1 Tax=Candidatus Gromoviella agglomerans TaxID=2806609 RepID=UPI001E29893F|nr:MFS transporter [Candidatus Gromoviella agglomerans]UFX98390.1 Multidrug transporter family protein [Candidatus Gromoviella agglomerans]
MTKFGFILALAFLELILYLSDDMYLPALTIIAENLGTTVEMAQYTLSAWYIGSGLFHIFAAAICEYTGRKRLLISGVIIFIISSAFCTITESIYTMILMRFFQGSSICCIDVAGYGTIHEENDDKNAAKIISFISSISIFAPIVGPMLGVILIEFSHWRMIFCLLSLCGIVGYVLIKHFMKNDGNVAKFSATKFVKEIKSPFLLLHNRRFILLSLTRTMLLSSIIIWIVQSPINILQSHTKWTLAIIQSTVFISFSLGTVVIRKLIDKYKFETLVQFTTLVLVILNGITLLFCKDLILTVGGVSILFFFAAMPGAPISRMVINSSEMSVNKKTSMFHTISNVGIGICVMIVSLIKINTLFQTVFAMLICSILAQIFYYFSCKLGKGLC